MELEDSAVGLSRVVGSAQDESLDDGCHENSFEVDGGNTSAMLPIGMARATHVRSVHVSAA